MTSEEINNEYALSGGAKEFIAGTVGGIAQIISGHPFDTLKVRLQTQGTSTQFNGALDCLRQTLANEGIKGLFKGMSSPIAGAALVNAVLFTAYGRAKNFLLERRGSQNEDGAPEPELTIPEAVLAGTFAGLVNCVVICPIELVKAKLQVQYERVGSNNARYSGPLDVMKKIVAQKGPLGLFKGMAATVYREMPAYAAYFGCYEIAKMALTPEGKSTSELSPLSLFLAGGIGGVGCWVFSYPQDLIKSRLQVQPENQPNKYKPFLLDGGFWRCGLDIVRTEGWIGLWRGFTPTIIRAFWANAATFFAYEMAFSFLDSRGDVIEAEDIEEVE